MTELTNAGRLLRSADLVGKVDERPNLAGNDVHDAGLPLKVAVDEESAAGFFSVYVRGEGGGKAADSELDIGDWSVRDLIIVRAEGALLDARRDL